MNAYDALPAIIETARRTSRIHCIRTRVVGTVSPRCMLWHYVVVPVSRGVKVITEDGR